MVLGERQEGPQDPRARTQPGQVPIPQRAPGREQFGDGFIGVPPRRGPSFFGRGRAGGTGIWGWGGCSGGHTEPWARTPASPNVPKPPQSQATALGTALTPLSLWRRQNRELRTGRSPPKKNNNKKNPFSPFFPPKIRRTAPARVSPRDLTRRSSRSVASTSAPSEARSLPSASGGGTGGVSGGLWCCPPPSPRHPNLYPGPKSCSSPGAAASCRVFFFLGGHRG